MTDSRAFILNDIPDLDAGFISHADLDVYLHARKRQRWQQARLLPIPRWIQGDRTRVAVFPTPVLVCLLGIPSRADVHRQVVELLEQAEHTAEFGAIVEIVRSEAISLGPGRWTLRRILGAVSRHGRERLSLLGKHVDDMLALAFAEYDIHMEVFEAVVVRTHPQIAVVAAGREYKFDSAPTGALAQGMPLQMWTVHECDVSRQFLLPSVATPPESRSSDIARQLGLERSTIFSDDAPGAPRRSTLFTMRDLSGRTRPTFEELDALLAEKVLPLEEVIYGDRPI